MSDTTLIPFAELVQNDQITWCLSSTGTATVISIDQHETLIEYPPIEGSQRFGVDQTVTEWIRWDVDAYVEVAR